MKVSLYTNENGLLGNLDLNRNPKIYQNTRFISFNSKPYKVIKSFVDVVMPDGVGYEETLVLFLDEIKEDGNDS